MLHEQAGNRPETSHSLTYGLEDRSARRATAAAVIALLVALFASPILPLLLHGTSLGRRALTELSAGAKAALLAATPIASVIISIWAIARSSKSKLGQTIAVLAFAIATIWLLLALVATVLLVSAGSFGNTG